jgi:GntR family transcriptional regulator
VRASPSTLVSSLIEARYGRSIARIHQEIKALCLTKAMAAEWKADAGSAALKVARRYLDAKDEAFEISVSIHPADLFTFAMELSRSSSTVTPRSRPVGIKTASNGGP